MPVGRSTPPTPPGAAKLSELLWDRRFSLIGMNNWEYNAKDLGYTFTQRPTGIGIGCPAQANFWMLTWARLMGFNPENNPKEWYWWANKNRFRFGIARNYSNANAIMRWQIKTTWEPPGSHEVGNLASVGVGIIAKNLALYGESYGTSRSEVDLGVSLSLGRVARIRIVHDFLNGVEWWVDGVKRGEETDWSKIPQTQTANTIAMLSLETGITATAIEGWLIPPFGIMQDLDTESLPF